MIPKIAHFIWFGSRPSWVTNNIELFRKFHPTWQIKLHDETTDWLSYIPESLQSIAINSKWLATRSDILRYAILKQEGGIYLDTDVLTLRPFDDLLKCDCFATRANTGHSPNGYANCAVMGNTINSAGISQALLQCEKIANSISEVNRRSLFGPLLLTKEFLNKNNQTITLLPSHYFYLFGRINAHKFQALDEDGRKEMINAARGTFTDGIEPYAVHLWGVFSSGRRSSRRTVYEHGDALVYNLRKHFKGQETITGAEIGVFGGKLSEHLLRNCSNLTLYMVDRWKGITPNSPYNQADGGVPGVKNVTMQKYRWLARKRTIFASGRRFLLRGESVDIAKNFKDESLDFVFIDANHYYEGVFSDLKSWYPKVRNDGLISGHDIDNPCDTENLWGVRDAVTDFMKEKCPQTKLELGNGFTYFFEKVA